MKKPFATRAVWRTALLALMLPVLLAAAPARGIDAAKTVNLPAKTTTRSAAIAQIHKQTTYKVVFDVEQFDDGKTVNFGKTQLPLGDVLTAILAGSGNTYTSDGKYIVFHKKAEETPSQVAVFSNRAITGTITDADTGKPRAGLQVEVLDTQVATATNDFGRFILAGLKPGIHVIRVAYPDGAVRYRTVNLPTGKDVDVAFALGGEIMQGSASDQEPTARPEPKTTAYYREAKEDEYTVRAMHSEPNTDYTLVPLSKVNGNYLPKFALSTNLLLYGVLTPNIDADWALSRKWTMGAGVAYNPFYYGNESVTKYWLARLKGDYWFCNRFERWHIGLHALGGRFNVGNVELPFTHTFDNEIYKGWGAGGGVHGGYHAALGKRTGLDFRLGAGYVYLEYDKYRCEGCDQYIGRYNRHYWGITEAAVAFLIYLK